MATGGLEPPKRGAHLIYSQTPLPLGTNRREATLFFGKSRRKPSDDIVPLCYGRTRHEAEFRHPLLLSKGNFTMNSPFEKGDKVVAYCRYSEGDEQGLKNTSTEEQAEAIRKFCDENRLQLVSISKHIGFRREMLDTLVIEKGIELLSDSQYKKDVEAIVAGLQSPFSYTTDKLSIDTEIAKIDRKISRISSAIEDSDEPPTTLVKRLSELEKQRAELSSQLASKFDYDSRDKILAEFDRLRIAIVDVLKNEKSTTDELRNALSLFIHSVVIYPDKQVLIRHILPGMVASTTSGDVSAPPHAVSVYSQLIESLFIL